MTGMEQSTSCVAMHEVGIAGCRRCSLPDQLQGVPSSTAAAVNVTVWLHRHLQALQIFGRAHTDEILPV